MLQNAFPCAEYHGVFEKSLWSGVWFRLAAHLTPISVKLKSTDIFVDLGVDGVGSEVVEFESIVVEPGDAWAVVVEGGFAEDGVVAAAVEGHAESAA